MIKQSNIQVYGIIIAFVLLAGVFLLPTSSASTTLETLEEVIDVDDTETLEEVLEEIDEEPFQFSAGDEIGKSRMVGIINYVDGSQEEISSESSLFLGASTFLRSGKEIDTITFKIDYLLDQQFSVIESTADFNILVCPANEYCDEQGSPSSEFLCEGCDIQFDGASPYVVFNPKDYEGRLRYEDLRVVFKADWLHVKAISSVDEKLYSVFLGCQSEGSCSQILVATFTKDANEEEVVTLGMTLHIEQEEEEEEEVMEIHGGEAWLGDEVIGKACHSGCEVGDDVFISCSTVRTGQCESAIKPVKKKEFMYWTGDNNDRAVCHYTFIGDTSQRVASC